MCRNVIYSFKQDSSFVDRLRGTFKQEIEEKMRYYMSLRNAYGVFMAAYLI